VSAERMTDDALNALEHSAQLRADSAILTVLAEAWRARAREAELLAHVRSLAQERAWTLEEAAKVAEAYEPRCESCPRGVAAAIRAKASTY
jgi:hypothetical protein